MSSALLMYCRGGGGSEQRGSDQITPQAANYVGNEVFLYGGNDFLSKEVNRRP